MPDRHLYSGGRLIEAEQRKDGFRHLDRQPGRDRFGDPRPEYVAPIEFLDQRHGRKGMRPL